LESRLALSMAHPIDEPSPEEPSARPPAILTAMALPGSRVRGLAALVLAAVAAAAAAIPAPASAQDRPPGIYVSDLRRLDRHTAYLTFDDGPGAWTAPVLDALRAARAKATFFVCAHANDAAKDPDRRGLAPYRAELLRMIDEGHAIGNHTASHADLAGLTEEAVARELDSNQEELDAVLAAAGRAPYHMGLIRPPHGSPYMKGGRSAAASAALAARGVVALWNVDSTDSWEWAPGDWLEPGRGAGNEFHDPTRPEFRARADAVASAVLAEADGRGIVVLFHDTHATTREALPSILAELGKRGYRFETLERLWLQALVYGRARKVAGDLGARATGLAAAGERGPVYVAVAGEGEGEGAGEGERDRILVWSGARTSKLREPAGGAAGLAIEPGGGLIVCERVGARVTRLEPGGRVVVLADAYEGRPLGAPADVVLDGRGGLYFSDARGGAVYRIPPPLSGGPTRVAQGLDRPSGLALAAGRLFVAEEGAGRVLAYPVRVDGALGDPAPFARGSGGGMAVDRQRNLYVPVAEGIAVLARDGRRIGTIEVPERPAACRLAGKRLHIAAGASLYAVDMAVSAPD